MAELVLLNPKMYVAGLDFSGAYSQHALVMDADSPEFTAFGDTTREYKGGLIGVGSEHQGFWDNPVDSDLFTNVAAAARNMTLTPEAGADGDRAFFCQTIGTKYSPGANIGDAYAFSASNQVSGTLTRGLIMGTGAKTVTGNSTARQLGAVSATQKIRASLHVLAVSGTSPTLNVTVRSDDTEGFASPTTRITFPQRTAIGGELLTADGAITDAWWRVTWTIGGTSPSFTFVIAVGVA